ncbi:MAG: polysaccharide deacetylase family protein [Proteobacteria bacterium]|nr:polysaccharide deacetylase family protein [Pseudomonadota bacterium]
MAVIALKIDVDTWRGTREGALRLAELLQRLAVPATFLFSLGPDNTGRAIRRVFRRGFFGKVKRTSVVQHYGLKTLLYGVLLPGPHIGRSCAVQMRAIAAQGFEAGVHTWDHVRWQDGVSRAPLEWTRRELARAHEQFEAVFGRAPEVHGAAGWQMNGFVPGLEAQMGFRYASDTRGTGPFMPVTAPVMQLPTTLPTLDELIGREDLAGVDPVDHLLSLTAQDARDQVFTLHAELEGGVYLGAFERLLRAWRDAGHTLIDLGGYARRLDREVLPRCTIEAGTVPGRAGLLAVQGSPVAAT